MNDRAVGGLVAAVLVIGAVGTLVPDGPPAGDAGDGRALRVVTWNVHQWWNGHLDGQYGLEAVRDTLRGLSPDVVALQESEGTRITSGGLDGAAWLADALGMRLVRGPPAAEQTYGVALLVRGTASDVTWTHLPTDGTIERVALRADVATPNGTVRFVVTHLEIEPHAAVRAAQAEAVVRFAGAGRPLVVLGDMNTPATMDDPAYRVLAGNYTDAWLAAGGDPDAGHTSPVPGPDVRIDHIWLRGPWTVTHAATFGDADASDHRGVVVDLEWP